MTDKIKTSGDRMREGNQAKIELEQTRAAYERIAAKLFDEWLNTEPADTQARERIYFTALGMARVRQELVETINTGMIEAAAAAASRKEDEG